MVHSSPNLAPQITVQHQPSAASVDVAASQQTLANSNGDIQKHLADLSWKTLQVSRQVACGLLALQDIASLRVLLYNELANFCMHTAAVLSSYAMECL